MTNSPVLDFVLLTGFLGSGKTTLLAAFLATPAARDTAVIVNEVGEIGLDGAILAESGSGVSMTMLANGCICCRMGSDLAATVRAVIEAKQRETAVPLRRIVLETSGLSKPGPILRQLAELADLRMRVAVVTTYDAVRGPDSTQFEEAAAQWAAAHRIVATKLDVVPASQHAAVVAQVAAINPLAEIVSEAVRSTAVDQAFAPLAMPLGMVAPDVAAVPGHSRIAVRLVMPVGLPSYGDLAAWLDNLGGALGERLLRLKGIVRVADDARPLLVQSVGTLFSEPRPFGAPEASVQPFLIVIVRDLGVGELEDIAPRGLFVVMR